MIPKIDRGLSLDHIFGEKNVENIKFMKEINSRKMRKKLDLGESNQGFRGAGSPQERYATHTSDNRGQKLVPVYFGSPIVTKFNN